MFLQVTGLLPQNYDESSGMSMSLESGAVGALIAKFGWIKVLSFGAALIGAGIMAVFRPPKSRREMFLQAAVALGCSFLFGGLGVSIADSYLHVGTEALIAPVHGLLGALSWGIFGGLAHMRDKVENNPLETIQEVKDVISK